MGRILCRGDHSYGYKFTSFHRVVPGFIIQGGDVLRLKGTCSKSIYNGGGYFPDENFELKHTEGYLLSMANAGPNTNGSQFFITFKPTPWLNGRHTVFGQVLEGFDIVDMLEKIGSGSGKTTKTATIVDSGILE